MTVKLPPSIKLPKPSLLESLGKGLGSGFSKGVESGISQFQQQLAQQQKQQYEDKKNFEKEQLRNEIETRKKLEKDYENFDSSLMKKLKDIGYDSKGDDPRDLIDFIDRGKELAKILGNPAAAEDIIVKEMTGIIPKEKIDEFIANSTPKTLSDKYKYFMNNPNGDEFKANPTDTDRMITMSQNSFAPEKDASIPEEKGALSKGYNRLDRNLRNSATGILQGKGLSLDELRSIEAEDPKWYIKALDSMTSLFADFPFMGAAAIPGGIVGGEVGALGGPAAPITVPLGAAAGAMSTAFAARELVMSGYRHWLEHKESGGKLTFEEFTNRANDVAKDVNKAALSGAIMGAGGAVSIPAEVLSIPVASIATEGRLPSPQEFATNASFLSFLHLGKYASGKLKGKPIEGFQKKNPADPASPSGPTAPPIDSNGNVTFEPKATKVIEKIQTKVEEVSKSTGLSKEEISNKIIEDNPQLDAASLFQGNAKEANTVLRSLDKINVKPLTKEEIRANEPTLKSKKIYKETEKLKSIEEMESDIAVQKQYADILSKSPLEDYIETATAKAKREAAPHTESKQLKLKEIDDSIKLNRSKSQRLDEELSDLKQKVKEKNTSNEERSRYMEEANNIHKELLALHDELGKLKFERRYGKKPMTKEELEVAIKKHVEGLREAIRDPQGEKAQKLDKDIARDQKYIETAEKLSERGLMHPEKMEEYIDINKSYNQAYGEMINELENELKGKEKSKAKNIIEKRKLLELLKKNKKISDAKLVIGKDRKLFKEKMSKPGSKFFKQYLHDLRNDILQFRKDFFNYRKKIIPEEGGAKTKAIGKEYFNKIQTLDEFGKANDVAPEVIKEAKLTAKEIVTDIQKEAKETKADQQKTPKELMEDIQSKRAEEAKESPKKKAEEAKESPKKKAKETITKKEAATKSEEKINTRVNSILKNLPVDMAIGVGFSILKEVLSELGVDKKISGKARYLLFLIPGLLEKGLPQGTDIGNLSRLGSRSVMQVFSTWLGDQVIDFAKEAYWAQKLRNARAISRKAEMDVKVEMKKKFSDKKRASIYKKAA